MGTVVKATDNAHAVNYEVRTVYHNFFWWHLLYNLSQHISASENALIRDKKNKKIISYTTLKYFSCTYFHSIIGVLRAEANK